MAAGSDRPPDPEFKMKWILKMDGWVNVVLAYTIKLLFYGPKKKKTQAFKAGSVQYLV